ncbi:MAG: alpha/beta hydrolase [Sandaracinaceae bacterium]
MNKTLPLLLALALLGCDESSDPADSGTSAGDAGQDAGPPPQPTAPVLPEVTGTCPDMSQTGVVTFSPEGIGPRDVQLYVSEAAADSDGPFVTYWHGAGSQPQEAVYGMGSIMDSVLAAGGIVAAPVSNPEAGLLPWFLTSGVRLDDLILADEILACAVAGPGVDVTRIHAMGMSAGGLHTSQMAFRRASYLASVAIYSGGLLPTSRAPRSDGSNNRLPVLMFHGGPTDIVAIRFDDASRDLWDALDDRGHTAIICDHNRGHIIPTEAQPDIQLFFDTHPFGTVPSPWRDTLPNGFYDVCALAP